MRALLRTRWSTTGDASGFSLAELLVTMMVGSIVLIAVGVTFTGTLRGARGATVRISSTAEARLAMDVMERRLRVAVRPVGSTSVFVSATRRSARFYASLAKAGVTTEVEPSLVDYAISGSCLNESITPAVVTVTAGVKSYTWPSSGTRTSCLARGVINATTDLFSFYTEATPPQPVSATATVAPAAPAIAFDGTGTLPNAALDTVLSVGIKLTVRNASTTVAPATVAQSRISLSNRINENISGRDK